MANMSYCRFQNTADALEDCWEHIDDPDTSDDEKRERERLYNLCQEFVYSYDTIIKEDDA